jgi:hypothetical protein
VAEVMGTVDWGELESNKSHRPQNSQLQLARAMSRVAIAVRVLEVQRQSALSRAFKKAACS